MAGLTIVAAAVQPAAALAQTVVGKSSGQPGVEINLDAIYGTGGSRSVSTAPLPSPTPYGQPRQLLIPNLDRPMPGQPPAAMAPPAPAPQITLHRPSPAPATASRPAPAPPAAKPAPKMAAKPVTPAAVTRAPVATKAPVAPRPPAPPAVPAMTSKPPAPTQRAAIESRPKPVPVAPKPAERKPAAPVMATPTPVAPAAPIAPRREPKPRAPASSNGLASRAVAPPPPPPPPALTPAPAPKAATPPVAPTPAPAKAASPPAAQSPPTAGKAPQLAKLEEGEIMQIAFRAGSAAMGTEAEHQLSELAREMRDNEARLQLKAYAESSDLNSSKARRLSLSRALAVRSYLIENGMRSTRIDVRALGIARDSGPADRVDIVLLAP